MTPSSDNGAGSAFIARRLVLARLALVWEDLVIRSWRAASLVILFLGLVLLGVVSSLPGILHIAFLAFFGVAMPLVLWWDFRGFAWPGDEPVRRRLETGSGVPHRPLMALDDRYAGDLRDGASQALFEMHRAREAGRVRRLRVGWPLSAVASRDRFALRYLALLVLAWGAIAGWSQARANFTALLQPGYSVSGGAGAAGEATFWITPPAYTDVAPIWFEQGGEDHPVPVPVGSELVAQVRGGSRAPVLTVDDVPFEFTSAGGENWQIAHVLDTGTRFSIIQSGLVLDGRTITLIADEPPGVALTADPAETLRTGLRLDIAASDDYGLESITGEIRRPDGAGDDVLLISVPLAQPGIRTVSGPAFYNLMAHPWAGHEVELVLVATDEIGQRSASAVHAFELPERFFHHPVAREIAKQRKAFAVDGDLAGETASVLHRLSREPETYLSEVDVHLALVTGALRLDYSAGRESTADDVIGLMWETALAIEEGPLAFAEQRVRDLQQQILEALGEGAPDAEIERLLAELRHAMDDYMRALSNRLRSDPGELFDPTEALKAVGSRELTDLVDRISELVRTGSRQQARTLLTRLQEIMESISVGNLSDLSGSSSAEAVELIQTIRQIISEQQQLLDESFRILRDVGEEDVDTAEQAGRQADVKDVLESFMERMEEFGYDVPRHYSRANRSMRRAVRQLKANRPGHAVDHQTEAVDFLKEGAGDMMAQILDLLGESVAGDSQGFFSAPRDPIGRSLGNSIGSATDDINIPDKGSLIRVRQILDELKRRAAEQHRPQEEQEYLRRLLRRF